MKALASYYIFTKHIEPANLYHCTFITVQFISKFYKQFFTSTVVLTTDEIF